MSQTPGINLSPDAFMAQHRAMLNLVNENFELKDALQQLRAALEQLKQELNENAQAQAVPAEDEYCCKETCEICSTDDGEGRKEI